MNEIFIFVILFLIPLIWFRTLYYTYRKYFNISELRKETHLQIHHLHYGLILITICTLLLLIIGKNNYVVGIFGFGLGLCLDEFVPALLMPGNRPVELQAYEKGFVPTLIIFIIIATIAILAGLFLS